MAIIQIRTTQNIQIDYLTAGIGSRILATLIDFSIYLTYSVSVAYLIDNFNLMPNSGLRIWVLSVPILLYQLLCEVFMDGQSFGKKVLNIKVVSLDGKKPSIGQYLLRWVLRLVDIGLIFPGGVACIAVAASNNEQRLGDMAAGTTVIKLNQKFKRPEVQIPDFKDAYEPTFFEVTALSDTDIRTVQKVLRAYPKLEKKEVIAATANKLKEVLAIAETEKSDLDFLKTVVKDYRHLTSV